MKRRRQPQQQQKKKRRRGCCLIADQAGGGDDDDATGFKREKVIYDYFVPILYHNFKFYDSRLLISHLHRESITVQDVNGKSFVPDIKVIAGNSESFISIEFLGFRFIDSFLFLNASLDTLVTNLKESGTDKFPHVTHHFGSDSRLYNKGVFCYDYLSSREKFAEK